MLERCSHFQVLFVLKGPKYCRNMFGVIQDQLNLFVNNDTFPEQIVITEMFSKFRSFLDCACLLRARSPRDII